MLFVGIDWAEANHDVAIRSAEGRRLKDLKIAHDVGGLIELQAAIAEFADAPAEVMIGVESSHGLLVNALVSAGYVVYDVNPLAAKRAREGQSLAGAKSDARDAEMLAGLIRTDRHRLRPLAGDSELAQEIRARARAHLRAVRDQVRLRNQLRSRLREYFPALASLIAEEHSLSDALAILSVAPNPTLARRLSLSKLESLLRRHGRRKQVAARAAALQERLRAAQLELGLPRLTAAHSDEVASLVRRLLQLRAELEVLEEQLKTAFRLHPDAEIYLSSPGLGDILGARVLGESGDDPARYPNARARRNYSGNAPVTKASGRYRQVSRRVVRNRRLADAGFRWGQQAVLRSPGAKRLYDRMISQGHGPNEATRAVANKLAGILHACLRDHRPYDEASAWSQSPAGPAMAA